LKNKSITTAVLGESGFIGHYLLIELLKESRNILVLDIKRPAIETERIQFIDVSNFGEPEYILIA
jgi:nucleoside-diphosphate-sugar epimerase